MGKEEIARYEQFLLFPQCFQKACFPGASKGVIVWEWVKETRCLSEDIINQDQFVHYFSKADFSSFVFLEKVNL